MSWIGAAIGAGASLIGNIFGSSNTKKTNENNLKINQMNNEFNERMMKKQMDYNTMMWNKQNAYNSPVAQRQRIEEAGFNPYMMMNGGSAGNATSMGSTSAASAAGASPQQAYHPDFSGIPQSILMAKQGKNIDEDTNSKVIDNQTRALKNMQEIANTIADTNNKQIQEKLSRVQLNYADELAMTQIQNTKAKTENLLREGLLMSKELAIFDEQTRLRFATMSADILLRAAQTKQTKQQTIHEIQKMYETCAKTQGLKISNDTARRMADSIVKRAFYEARPTGSWAQIIGGIGSDIGWIFKGRDSTK